MHKKLLLPALIGATFAASALADEAPAAPASPWSFNVGVVSDYLFRGVSQTHGGPALQGGVTYTHPSGFYATLWGSNQSWVKDGLGSGSLEIDVAAGYKNTFGDSKLGYDVGYYTYNYPSHGSTHAPTTFLENPNTQELYGALTYDLGNNNSVNVKYSYATSKYFIGWYNADNLSDIKDSRGSGYLEANGSFDLGNGWGLTAHVGHQRVANLGQASYTDLNVGVTKDVGFGVVGFLVSTTDASGGCDANHNAASFFPSQPGFSAYCWGDKSSVSPYYPTDGWKNVARTTAVLSFVKTF